jgi:cytochrome oxidase Cu insertion factor (SCO1/SenC/PrrC family)
MMTKTQKILTATLWCLTAVALLTLIGGAYALRARSSAATAGQVASTQQDVDSTSVLFTAPQFRLLDQNSHEVTDQQLRGHVWVAAFVFTHCAGPCPMMFAKLKQMQAAVPDPNIKLVTFTVDPERDTPEVLKKKLAELGADESRCTFLTGDKAAIDAVAKGMLQPRPQDGDSPLLHSTALLLFDSQNQCRGRYLSTEESEMTRLKTDAEALAAELTGKRS